MSSLMKPTGSPLHSPSRTCTGKGGGASNRLLNLGEEVSASFAESFRDIQRPGRTVVREHGQASVPPCPPTSDNQPDCSVFLGQDAGRAEFL